MKKQTKFPAYVTLGETALRYALYGKYYRDAGRWDVSAKWENGKLICADKKGPMAHSYGQELKKCSFKYWKKDNQGHLEWLSK